MSIPKIIHTYWDGKKSPFTEECFKRMRSLNPEWTVKIHNIDTFKAITDLDIPTPQKRANILRIHYILNEGGVWADANCYFIKPIHEFIDLESSNVIGYSAPWQDNVLENWFFAAPPRHPLVEAWRNEYMYAHQIGLEEYKTKVPEWLKEENIYNHLPYLTMHACYRVVSKRTGLKAVLTKSVLGPFKYLYTNNNDTGKAVLTICTSPIDTTVPFYKIRGPERSVVDNTWVFCSLNPASINKNAQITKNFTPEKRNTTCLFIVLVICIIVYTVHISLSVYKHNRNKTKK